MVVQALAVVEVLVGLGPLVSEMEVRASSPPRFDFGLRGGLGNGFGATGESILGPHNFHAIFRAHQETTAALGEVAADTIFGKVNY